MEIFRKIGDGAIAHFGISGPLPLLVRLFVLTVLVLAFFDPALAQDGSLAAASTPSVELAGTDLPQKSIQALMMLLVLAILIESGLSVVFEWSVYRAYFAKGALKPMIAVAVSFIVVRGFELDILAELIESYRTGEVESVSLTQFLTALILAGGSHTVNRVRKSLGLEESASDDPPSATHGWLSVRVERGRAIKGPVRVTVTEVENSDEQESIAGMALARRPGLASLFFRNNDRFPATGGYALDPKKSYKIAVVGQTSDGILVRKQITDGPIKLAVGAIVDFDVKLQEPQ